MRVNVLGNGPQASLFKRGADGKLLICNMPPFDIPSNEVHASCMVDFKMMKALFNGMVTLDKYDWILGTRPRRWMEMKPGFYLKYAQNIKGFHKHVPKYAQLPGQDAGQAATNYSCGHMAVDYACRTMKANEVHLYGFDSMFSMSLKSYTDLILASDRSTSNTHRITNNWRPVWQGLFKEFSNVKFYLHHNHDSIKLNVPSNVNIIVGE